ncbi:MAG: hypothetical protein ACOY94_18290 [Bacillota bacterium]
MGTWRLLLVPLLLMASLLSACSGSNQEAVVSTPTATPAPAATQAPPPASAPADPSLAAVSTPAKIQEMLVACLTAMSEGKWEEARKHLAAASLTDEALASKWQSILSMEYNGDPSLIGKTQVMSVLRSGDSATLKLRTPASGLNGKATLLWRDSRWHIVDFGDTALE